MPPEPERYELELKFVDNESGTPIGALLVQVHFVPGNWNSYVLSPLMTNEDGAVSFTESEVQALIQRWQKQCPADYKGRLEDCTVILVVVASHDDLERQLLAATEWNSIEAKELAKCLPDAVNRSFLPCTREFAYDESGSHEIRLRLQIP